jgi:two-component system, LytTR family, response regulator
MPAPLRTAASEPSGAGLRPASDPSTPLRPTEGVARFPAVARPEPLLRLVIHKGTRLLVVRLDEVDWIEGAGNYVEVHVRQDCHLHRQTLASLHARLDPRRFARIHRSAIVRLDAIAQIERGSGGGEVELRDGSRLAVSRRYRRELLARLGAE